MNGLGMPGIAGQTTTATVPSIVTHVNVLSETKSVLEEAVKILEDRFYALHGTRSVLDLTKHAEDKVDASIASLSNECSKLASQLHRIISSL